MFLFRGQRDALKTEITRARSLSEKTTINQKYKQLSNVQTDKLICLIKSCNSPKSE